MSKFYAAFFFLFVLISSCTKEYSNKVVSSFTAEDFNQTMDVSMYETLYSDSLVSPVWTDIVGHYLMVIDDRSNGRVHIYNLFTLAYEGSFGHPGHGPGEIEKPWVVGHDEHGLFYLYDFSNRKMMAWNPDSLIAGRPPQKEFKFNEKGLTSSVAVEGENILITDPVRPEGKFFSYDTINFNMTPVGEMPALTTSGVPTTLSMANHSMLSYNNDRVVIASYFAPFFEIYHPATGEWSSFLGPEQREPKFAEINQEGSMVFTIDSKETRAGFIDIKTSGKYIYLLYSGQLLADTDHASGKVLMVFDYKGSSVKQLRLPKSIVSFSVYNDSVVYALSVDLKPEVISFNLN